jgi:hypothetical protein
MEAKTAFDQLEDTGNTGDPYKRSLIIKSFIMMLG